MKRVRGIPSFIKKHKKALLLLLVPILILGFFLRPKPPKPIETVTVKREKLVQTLSATGTVQSQTAVDLSFLTAGKLVYLGVKKGDMVKKGQTIATLDQRTAQKNLEKALRDYSLQRNTFETNEVANQNRTPQEALNDAMRRILENNQYDLDKAVISVDLQDLAKQNSVLTSPIAGIVTRADAKSAGVNVTTTTTFTVADPTHLIFQMDVDEADIGKVRPTQPVTLTLDAYPDKKITVPVDTIDFASHATATGGNAYTVEASFPENADFSYRVGMNGDAEITLAEVPGALTIPISSIVDDSYVYVLQGKLFVKRKVTLGMQTDIKAEVMSGLHEGDVVAIQPSDVEKRQNIVRPTPESS